MNTKAEATMPMTKAWSWIVARYDKDPSTDASVAGVADLARYIQKSELSSGLFGWMSMHDLCITQTEVTYPYYGPYLRVKPLFNGQIELRYIDTPDELRQWQRNVPATDVIEQLNLFLSQLQWFGSVRGVPPMTPNPSVERTANGGAPFRAPQS